MKEGHKLDGDVVADVAGWIACGDPVQNMQDTLEDVIEVGEFTRRLSDLKNFNGAAFTVTEVNNQSDKTA